ncbi:MAG: hypothetical protein D6776_00770 [Planctomycetota bacterium]|nr:MAG: hypothetical protein D6776_00770 [Planctomycetota bacterium]
MFDERVPPMLVLSDSAPTARNGPAAQGVHAMADRLARTCGPWLAAVTVVLGAVLTASAVPVWNSDWIVHNGSEYRVTGVMDWNAAQAQAQSVGANLVTINDAAEQAWIETNLLPTYQKSIWGFWIGLYQPAGSPEPAGGWQWVSGEPASYRNWRAGEPNNSGTNGIPENFAHMLGTRTSAPGAWNDVNPTDTILGPIVGLVERPLAAPVPEPVGTTLAAIAVALFVGCTRRRQALFKTEPVASDSAGADWRGARFEVAGGVRKQLEDGFSSRDAAGR